MRLLDHWIFTKYREQALLRQMRAQRRRDEIVQNIEGIPSDMKTIFLIVVLVFIAVVLLFQKLGINFLLY